MIHTYCRIKTLIFTLTCLLLPSVAYAWGEDGHDIIADIAARELTPQAAAKIKDLLGQQTLVDVAAWADQVRRKPQYQWSAPLHYVNVPPGSDQFDYQRDCPDGECVVGAIHRFIAELRDPAADRAEKADALKFLVHFVGDIHQPLHVSYAHDKGGNDIKVEFFHDRTNLHTVWDSLIIRHAGQPWREHANQLYARITLVQYRQWTSSLDPAAWATESFRLAVSHAYNIPKDGQLDQAYYERNLPVVEERLSMAGIRLGALLNAVFGDGQGLPTPPPVTTQPATQPASTQPATTQPTTHPSGARP